MGKMPKILTQAKAAPMFKHVGQPIDDPSVKTVPDWVQCCASLDGNDWVNLGTNMMNRIFAIADSTRDEDWMDQHWDGMIVSRKAEILRVIGPALTPIMRKHQLSKSFQYNVVGDFLRAWLLDDFEDAAVATLTERIIGWYLAGHVPCGFTGAKPKGKANYRLPDPKKTTLIVY